MRKIELAIMLASAVGLAAAPDDFAGKKPGDERTIAGVKLCWCPPGKFTMGSPPSEPERRPREDPVEVTLTHGFWIGKYEVTQGDWKRIVGMLPGPLTVELPEGDDYPVGNVNFAEAEAFCRKLTELAHNSGEKLPERAEFRLPTEGASLACRAGTTTATAFGDKLSSKQANFKGKPYNAAAPGPSLGKAAKVGSYPPNPWGLHDMHGNIFEWCRDWYHAKLPGGIDPDLHDMRSNAAQNRTGDSSRVRRGGAWSDDGWPCRSACRLRFELCWCRPPASASSSSDDRDEALIQAGARTATRSFFRPEKPTLVPALYVGMRPLPLRGELADASRLPHRDSRYSGMIGAAIKARSNARFAPIPQPLARSRSPSPARSQYQTWITQTRSQRPLPEGRPVMRGRLPRRSPTFRRPEGNASRLRIERLRAPHLDRRRQKARRPCR